MTELYDLICTELRCKLARSRDISKPSGYEKDQQKRDREKSLARLEREIEFLRQARDKLEELL